MYALYGVKGKENDTEAEIIRRCPFYEGAYLMKVYS